MRIGEDQIPNPEEPQWLAAWKPFPQGNFKKRKLQEVKAVLKICVSVGQSPLEIRERCKGIGCNGQVIEQVQITFEPSVSIDIFTMQLLK